MSDPHFRELSPAVGDRVEAHGNTFDGRGAVVERTRNRRHFLVELDHPPHDGWPTRMWFTASETAREALEGPADA